MAVLTVAVSGSARRARRHRAALQRFLSAYGLDAAPGVGVGSPLIKPKGIDDVPIVAVTLWTRGPDAAAPTICCTWPMPWRPSCKRVPGHERHGDHRRTRPRGAREPRSAATCRLWTRDGRPRTGAVVGQRFAQRRRHRGAAATRSWCRRAHSCPRRRRSPTWWWASGTVRRYSCGTSRSVQLGPDQPRTLCQLRRRAGSPGGRAHRLRALPRGDLAVAKKPGEQRRAASPRRSSPPAELKGIFIPGGRAGHGHAQLRRDRRGQGPEADPRSSSSPPSRWSCWCCWRSAGARPSIVGAR